MALPLSGIMKASMIREELKETGTWRAGSDSSRKLAKVPNGTIKFSDFYGKSMESPMDFWIEGRLTLSYDQSKFYGYQNVSFQPTKLPEFVSLGYSVMAGWSGDAAMSSAWYIETLTFSGDEFFKFNRMSRVICDTNGVELPETHEESLFVGGITKDDNGIPLLTFSTLGYDSSDDYFTPYTYIFDVFAYVDYEGYGDGSFKDVKIHIKLSNSLYYKLLGFVSSCLSSLFGGEHYGIA